MNNLVTILEKLLAVRKIAAEERVQAELDDAIQTILDMMKNQSERKLPPINYAVPITAPEEDGKFDHIWRTPIGGYRILCGVDTGISEGDATVSDRAKEIARSALGW